MREEKASALPLLLDVRRMDENNRAYAYRMLRKNIMTLQLQPGCQLSEAELCEQLAMSRTPVHEALMLEPTETEARRTLDEAVQALLELHELAHTDAEYMHNAPHHAQIKRPDEVQAARKPVLKYVHR